MQAERRGTAHAVLAARAAIEKGADDILVIFGDTPLISAETLKRLRGAIDHHAGVAVLGFRPANPTGYGRLITAGHRLVAIREEKDASEAERRIDLCNGGLMALRGDVRARYSRPHRQQKRQGRILPDRRRDHRRRNGAGSGRAGNHGG